MFKVYTQYDSDGATVSHNSAKRSSGGAASVRTERGNVGLLKNVDHKVFDVTAPLLVGLLQFPPTPSSQLFTFVLGSTLMEKRWTQENTAFPEQQQILVPF